MDTIFANLAFALWTVVLCAIGTMAAGYVGFRIFWTN